MVPENSSKSLPADLFVNSPFWQEKLQNLCHPTAMAMAQDLDQTGPLGIGDGNSNSFWKGFKHNFGQKDSNIDFLLRIKKSHPQKIILVQIGEFYETWGLDSVFLVEHCGINRMGRKGPRAGMPLANIQAALDDLTDAGFSVVVCQQADDISKKGRKVRFISEIITPSSPTYTYGLAMSHKGNIAFPETPPEFALCQDRKGIKIVEINPDLRTSLILEGLTKEAALIRLNRYLGRLNRIFLHDEIAKDIVDAANLKFHNLVKISGYNSSNFAKRVEELIKIDLGIDANISFLKVKPVRDKNSPNPLYQQSAAQIGILPKRGIPDLVNLMLPKASPSTCKHIIRSILLNPPSQNFASALRKTIIALQKNNKSLPNLIVSNPVRYIKTLNKSEAHPEILKELFYLSNIFLDCQKILKKTFVKNSLQMVSYLSSTDAKEDILSEVSHKIINILKPILPFEEDLIFEPKNELIPKTLFEKIEENFKGRISPNSNDEIANLYQEVAKNAQKYESIIESELMPIISNFDNSKTKKTRKPALTYDIHNQTIWLLGYVDQETIKKHNLIRPIDRYGKEVKDRFSSQKVEDVLAEYKNSAIKTYEAIRQILRITSQKLACHALPIIHLATFSNFVKTIYLHINEASSKNWTVNFAINKSAPNNIILEEFFPYWMKNDQAISNNLNFDGTCLLTGHNMAGKSTLIRSLAATSLLGSCGFMFPAKSLTLAQEIDGWFVRTGAQDDPEAGLSSFAVEMTDIKIALRDASKKSFLLIDELGKGTESKAGHAIAASVLEYLVEKKVRAIFATHWHEIFVNPLVNLQGAKLIKMHCEGDNPTYKVIDGTDLNSSAFYTAKKIGVDEKIIARAKEISAGYENPKITKIQNQLANDSLIKEVENFDPKEILANISCKNNDQIKTLKEDEIPPLSDIGYSIVYILKTSNNFFYVGESDNFLSRVRSHRSDKNKSKCQFYYTIIKEGKSQSRKIEQQLIAKLKNNNFPMLSIADETNSNFGSLNKAG